MAEDPQDPKSKIVSIMKQAANKKEKGSSVRAGRDSIIAGRDVNINRREIERVDYVPDDRHISPEMAKKIKDRVASLVDIEVTAGSVVQRSYAKWYGALKNRFNVPSYKLIPHHLGQDALDWLAQQSAIARPKLRRADNQKWRNEHYKTIWTKSKIMGMSKADVYHIVHERIGKKINSLKRLGERDLKKLCNIINGLSQKR